MLIPCLSHAQWDGWLKWPKWLTKDRDATVIVAPVKSISLDSTTVDSLQMLIVFGHADWDSAQVDTMRTGGSYVQFAKFGLADTAAFNDTTYYARFDSSNVTYYARVALIDSNAVYSVWKAASKRVDLTPESKATFNYVWNFLLR